MDYLNKNRKYWKAIFKECTPEDVKHLKAERFKYRVEYNRVCQISWNLRVDAMALPFYFVAWVLCLPGYLLLLPGYIVHSIVRNIHSKLKK